MFPMSLHIFGYVAIDVMHDFLDAFVKNMIHWKYSFVSFIGKQVFNMI